MTKPFCRITNWAEKAATLDSASTARDTQHLAMTFIPEMRSLEHSLARIEDHTPPRMQCPVRNVVVLEQTDFRAERYSPSGSCQWIGGPLRAGNQCLPPNCHGTDVAAMKGFHHAKR